MTTRKVYNIVKPREYVTASGENKTSWSRHGILIIDGDKVSLRIDSIPTGDWNGWLNGFEKEEMQQPVATSHTVFQPANFQQANDFNDIPF